MAITTKFTVKRSGVTGTPSNLASGELAYSYYQQIVIMVVTVYILV